MNLEQRVAEALEAKGIASDAVAKLIPEVGAALAAAKQAVDDERRRALDLAQARDPKAALEAVLAAELTRDRLQAALPKLQRRYQDIRAREEYAAWLPRYEQAEAEQAALPQELAELYEPFVAKITDLLLRIEQQINTVRNVNGAKPDVAYGDGRHLSDQVVGAHILRDLKLPAWDPRAGMAWPPHRPLNPAMVAPIVPGDWRLYTGRWHEVQAERVQAAREQAKREQQQREAEVLENYRGPKWWEGEERGPERAA